MDNTLKEYGYAEKSLPSSHMLQLEKMGVRIPIVTKIRTKDGISVYRVESDGERLILKVFDKPEDTREIENYKLLTSLGIPVLPMLKCTENALLLPDVEFSTEYRLGVEQDMSDVETAQAVAHWYRVLHEKGRVFLSVNTLELYDEADVITLPNMDFVAEKTDTEDDPLWAVVREYFDDIRYKIDCLPRTLTYNDFYWTNLVVARDKSSAMMLDFNLLGKGPAYGDVRNVASALRGEAKAAFIREYGEENIDDQEVTADAVISPLVTLYFACERETFPAWADTSRQELTQGTILENLKQWLNLP